MSESRELEPLPPLPMTEKNLTELPPIMATPANARRIDTIQELQFQQALVAYRAQLLEADIRLGEIYAKAEGLVPEWCRGKPNNCTALLRMARELDISETTAFLNLYGVKGHLSMSGKLAIALLKRHLATKNWTMDWEQDGDSIRVIVKNAAGEVIQQGSWLSRKTASLQGPLWKDIPELMLKYRTCRDFCNTYYPEVLMGVAIYGDDDPDAFQQPYTPPTAIPQPENEVLKKLPGKKIVPQPVETKEDAENGYFVEAMAKIDGMVYETVKEVGEHIKTFSDKIDPASLDKVRKTYLVKKKKLEEEEAKLYDSILQKIQNSANQAELKETELFINQNLMNISGKHLTDIGEAFEKRRIELLND